MAIQELSENFVATYSAGDAQDAVLIKTLITRTQRRIVVQLEIATGNGKVQTSASTPDAVKDGTAVWFDWPSGNVSASTQASLKTPPTAIRCYRNSGTVTMSISER